ncbi:MAG: hypothetical protein JKY53_01825 [Flavobacteriales bacterium]|nr:hypothetical protein [Flavobacteriales bacterium]
MLRTIQLYKFIYEDRPQLLKAKTTKLIMGTRGVAITGDAIHAMVEQLKPMFPDRKLSPATIRQSVIANWLNVDKLPVEDVQQMAGHKSPVLPLSTSVRMLILNEN